MHDPFGVPDIALLPFNFTNYNVLKCSKFQTDFLNFQNINHFYDQKSINDSCDDFKGCIHIKC